MALCGLAERLSCGDGERKTLLMRPTATSRCHQRFVRPRLFVVAVHGEGLEAKLVVNDNANAGKKRQE